MRHFLQSTFFLNALGLVFISLIWYIFSVVGLRGVAVGKSIKEIREEAGLSLLTLSILTLAILGLVAIFASKKAGAFSGPIAS